MNRFWSLVAALGLLVGAPIASQAQEVAFKAAFGGELAPLTKKLKEMDGNWRRITVGGSPSEGKGMLGGLGGFFGMMLGGGGNQVSVPPSYYTQGSTITVGQEVFLITYRHQVGGLDFGELVAQAGQGGPPKLPEPEKLTSDTDLQLTLVNVRSIQVVSGIRTFNLDRELADAQKEYEKEITLRKQMEGGPFGGLGGPGIAVPEPAIEDVPAPKAAPKKPAPKKPAPKRK